MDLDDVLETFVGTLLAGIALLLLVAWLRRGAPREWRIFD